LDRQKTPCESTVVQGWRHQGRCILPSNNALRGTVPNTVEISISEPQLTFIVHDLFIRDCGCNHSDSGGKALRRNRQYGNGKNLEFAKLASHNPQGRRVHNGNAIAFLTWSLRTYSAFPALLLSRSHDHHSSCCLAQL